MVTSMRLLAVALAAAGALLVGYSGELSPVWPDLRQFDWFLLAGLVCVITAGLLAQMAWEGRHG
jgi:hypothetical protein